MAEIEKLKVADEKYKVFKNLDKRLADFLGDINENFAFHPSAEDDEGAEDAEGDAEDVKGC